MAETFGTQTIERLAKELREPQWVTGLRRQALQRHGALPWPHPSDDIWRRTDAALLDPSRGFAPARAPLQESIRISEAHYAQFLQPLGNEELMVRVNGTWLTEPPPAGPIVKDLAAAAATHGEPIRRVLESDGFTEAEQKLTSLNAAFHQDDVFVDIPAGFTGAVPLRLVHVHALSQGQAVFPLTIIRVGAGSSVTLIDEYVSLASPGSADGAHLINGRIELVLEQGAQARYIRLQRWDARAREFLLLRSMLAREASLTLANLHLGAALSKTHLVVSLQGEQASSRLFGFVFGRAGQHIDQHTLQHHLAPRTFSDLQFKAALQDASRMVYTGLIRIAPQAKQTDAYQANHNLLLSRTASAETIPMLEILADDVQCKHGASTGPIDDEQAFYLMSRGVPREAAQRLLVMGFVEPIIQQVPFEPLQERLRQEIEEEIRQ